MAKVSSDKPGSVLKESVADMSERIQGIIDEAERTADEIQANARIEADREARRTVEARIQSLSGVVAPLGDRIDALRAEADALIAEIDDAAAELRKLTSVDSRAQRRPEPAPEPEPEPEREAGPELAVAPEPAAAPTAYPGTASAPDAPASEEALLRATQMAVSGSSRGEIEATLREDFGIADPSALVNGILGSN